MPTPALPFLANDFYWAELPLVSWLFVAIIFMLVAVARFGWRGANVVLSKYRVWWAISLATAIVCSIALGLLSGQPLPRYV